MKKIILIALLLFPLACSAQRDVTKPTSEEKAAYIPKNLEECFVELKKVLTPEQLTEFKLKKEEEIIEYHFSTGRWMRNFWGLWSRSRLKDYFNDLGVFHPDDISGIILTSFHRHLHNKDIKLEKQIQYYQDY